MRVTARHRNTGQIVRGTLTTAKRGLGKALPSSGLHSQELVVKQGIEGVNIKGEPVTLYYSCYELDKLQCIMEKKKKVKK